MLDDFEPIGSRVHDQALALHDRADELADGGIIISDQHPRSSQNRFGHVPNGD
jgi:hypothetical protein